MSEPETDTPPATPRSEDDFKKQQQLVLNFYALMGAALVMSFLPFISAALLALLMFGGGLIAAYIVRGRRGGQSYAGNHLTFIIRTIWIASLFSLVTMIAATIYILTYYDPGPVQACAEQIVSAAASAPDIMALQSMIQPCMDEFMRVNGQVFLVGGVIGIAPIVIYFVYRLSSGLSRAIKMHRIGDNKSWF